MRNRKLLALFFVLVMLSSVLIACAKPATETATPDASRSHPSTRSDSGSATCSG